LTTETRQCFFSWLVDGLNSYVQWQISKRGWTDQWQRHDASSLGWLTFWLVRCNSESAGTGGLIDGGNTMLFLGMIDSGNTTLLHLAGQWWEETLATCLVSSSLGWLTVWLVRQISKRGQTERRQQHNADSWYDQWQQHNTTSFGWLMVGGRKHWPCAWCDRQNSDACRNKTLYGRRNT
jgi:hypothetical protein